jgi:hypothetical protein
LGAENQSQDEYILEKKIPIVSETVLTWLNGVSSSQRTKRDELNSTLVTIPTLANTTLTLLGSMRAKAAERARVAQILIAISVLQSPSSRLTQSISLISF